MILCKESKMIYCNLFIKYLGYYCLILLFKLKFLFKDKYKKFGWFIFVHFDKFLVKKGPVSSLHKEF